MAAEQVDIRGQMRQVEQTEKVKQIFQVDRVDLQVQMDLRDQEEVVVEPRHYS